ncbi:hypothetical protein M409DRAFT_65982 [Zasmidium cellare ATCC 36951]|uniref:Cytochrome P450 n=1 Tax=Zasmidium cellare ATCC 36951 TaxID=1080233 RepID=A0A6A6CMU1_ZASCE|nr:uncharacterized protein M409DRAFT_65982 [Zasmidium cellare ATCC 36951]KAF2167943.1 hypothetical protein M409DRAFT_65982 [Zasmidium cellare ATCC 36951]
MANFLYLTAFSIAAAYIAARSAFPYAALIGFLIPFSYAIFLVFVYPFYFSPFRHLPEPKGAKFPWAHASEILENRNGPAYRKWMTTVPNGGMMRLRVLFNQERLLLTSPEAMKEVLVQKTYEFHKPSQPTFLFRQLLGNGILVAEGAEHKEQRKALLPAFSFRHIKELYPLFWNKARESTEEIAKASKSSSESGPEPQKAYEWASRTTLDIIGQSGLGYDFNATSNPDGKIVQNYRLIFDNEPPNFRWTFVGIWAPLELMWYLRLPPLSYGKTIADSIRSFLTKRVQEKRGLLEKDAASQIDIMSIAMKSGQFSDAEVVDQMMTFLAAGHETTASALTWAIYQLCNFPKIQDRLREELRSSLPSIKDHNSTITAQQIESLPYLNAVCNEILRFIPSVPTTVRDALVDTTIQGQFIPKGTRIFLSPWAMNTSPTLWGPDAQEFNPDRWMADGTANSGGSKNNFAFLTFLHGPRSCIGKDFAKAEFLCLLAAWIARFRVRWPEGERLDMDLHGWVTVRPGHKLPVLFEEV